MSRRDARRHAFNLIFQFPFFQNVGAEALAEARACYFESLDMGDIPDLEKLTRPSKKDADYLDRAVWGVLDKQAELDGVIENFLRDWDINRINKVDLALIRLSIYEMLREPDVPLGVAVNEAVELAKEYGTDESPAFINGVLGSICREIKLKGRDKIG